LVLPELTEAQVAFLSGDVAALTPDVWWSLLHSGLIAVNPSAPPMFVLTAKGAAAVDQFARQDSQGQAPE